MFLKIKNYFSNFKCWIIFMFILSIINFFSCLIGGLYYTDCKSEPYLPSFIIILSFIYLLSTTFREILANGIMLYYILLFFTVIILILTIIITYLIINIRFNKIKDCNSFLYYYSLIYISFSYIYIIIYIIAIIYQQIINKKNHQSSIV